MEVNTSSSPTEVSRITLPATSNITIAIVMIILLLFGAIGNILALCTVLPRPKLRTTTNIFLMSLCLSDFTSALICSPLWLYRATWGFNEWKWPPFLCSCYWVLDFGTDYVTSLHILSFAVVRFMAVRFPLRGYKAKTKHVVAYTVLLWVLSFLMATPLLFFDLTHNNQEPQWPACSIADSLRYQTYILIVYPIFFYLPQIIVICLSIAIIQQVHAMRKRRKKYFIRTPQASSDHHTRANPYTNQQTTHDHEQERKSPPGNCNNEKTDRVIHCNTVSEKTGSGSSARVGMSIPTNCTNSTHNNHDSKYMKSISLQLTLVSASYLVGYIPMTIYMVWTTAVNTSTGHRTEKDLYTDYWFSVAAYMSLRCSECLNPVMYFLGSSQLRNEACEMLSNLAKRIKAILYRLSSVFLSKN